MRSYQITDETVVLADSTEVPGLRHLPVNAFLLRQAGNSESHHVWERGPGHDPGDSGRRLRRLILPGLSGGRGL